MDETANMNAEQQAAWLVKTETRVRAELAAEIEKHPYSMLNPGYTEQAATYLAKLRAEHPAAVQYLVEQRQAAEQARQAAEQAVRAEQWRLESEIQERQRQEATRQRQEDALFQAAERQTAMVCPLAYLYGDGPADARRAAVLEWLEQWEGPPSRLKASERDLLPAPAAFGAACRAILDDDKDGIYCYGPTGAAKTRTALAAIRLWLLVHRRGPGAGVVFSGPVLAVRDNVAVWASASALAVRATTAARSTSSWGEMVDELGTAPLLILDDLGHRIPPVAAAALRDIFERRLDDGKAARCTVVTSQWTAAEIARRNPTLDAAVRRLRERLRPVKFAKPAAAVPQ